MANQTSNVSFFGPQALGAALSPDTYQKQLQLNQQQALAQGLMQEGSTPIDPMRQAGGWGIPISPLEGLTHAGKSIAAALMQKNINKEQSDLATKQAQAMMGLFGGGQTAPQPSSSAGASGPNPMAPGGPSVMAGSGQQPPLQPMPQDAPQPPQQAPRPGMLQMPGMSAGQSYMAYNLAPEAFMKHILDNANPSTDFTKLLQASGVDPASAEGKRLIQANIQKQNSNLVNVRPEGTVFDASTNQPLFTAPKNGMQTQWTPQGPQVGVVPGFQGSTTQLSGTPLTNAPMQTIKLSNQRELQLTQPEYLQYTQSGGQVLPSRYQSMAQEIPGVQFKDAGPNAQPPAPIPQSPQGLQPIPGKVPQQDMGAFNAVASGQVPAAYGQGNQGPQKPPERAVVGATQSQGEQVQQARQTAGGKAVDEQFGKDYVAFTTGGAADAAKQLGQLQDVVKALDNPKANLTGPYLGRVPDTIKSVTNPNSIAMRERVEEVVQRSLRAILGAQFTEKEGERLIARAYNPNLPEKENAIRVGRLFTQLNQAFEAKQSASRYFEQNGTLDGWGGKIPSTSDFEPNGNSSSGQIQPSQKVVNWSDLGR